MGRWERRGEEKEMIYFSHKSIVYGAPRMP